MCCVSILIAHGFYFFSLIILKIGIAPKSQIYYRKIIKTKTMDLCRKQNTSMDHYRKQNIRIKTFRVCYYKLYIKVNFIMCLPFST